MDLNQLKLQLIQRILEAADTEVLQAVLRVLQLEKVEEKASPPGLSQDADPPQILDQGQTPTGVDVRQLQQDIDEIFGEG